MTRVFQGGQNGRVPASLPHGDAATAWESTSAAATEAFGARLGQGCRGGEVIALVGELGTGKTCLVRGIARGLGISDQNVASPTFALIHEYGGGIPLVHVDLYRLATEDAINRLGLEEYLESAAVIVIEWAEKAQTLLPQDHLCIQLQHEDGDRRLLSFYPVSKRYEDLIQRALRIAQP